MRRRENVSAAAPKFPHLPDLSADIIGCAKAWIAEWKCHPKSKPALILRHHPAHIHHLGLKGI